MNGKKPKEMFSVPDSSSLNDLIGDGVVFEISDGCSAIDLNNLDSSSDDEDVPDNEGFDDPVIGSKYVKESFKELKTKMVSIDDTNTIFKSIIHSSDGEVVKEDSVTTILMSNYLEGKSTPLTAASKFKPMKFNLSEGTLLPGILKAILTMNVGEKSKFLIDYSLMYGELGCPPVIPKKAICLVYICVLKSTKEENQYVLNDNDLLEEAVSESTFVSVEKKVKVICDEAKYHINNDHYNNASRLLSNALHMLNLCSLANEEEENKQKNIMHQIYIELAGCYNKLNMPKKVCIMCNEFRRIFNINKNWKMLYFNAVANKMLGNMDIAKTDLKKAKKINGICKNDKEKIENELKSIERHKSAFDTYKEEVDRFLNNQSKERDVKFSNEQQVANDFLKEIENICESINNDPLQQRYKLDLPSGLSDNEIRSIDLIATTYGMSIVNSEEIDNKKSIIFIKNT